MGPSTIPWRTTRGFVVLKDVETRLRKYVVDRIGTKLVAAVTRDDVESIVAVLDAAITERKRAVRTPTLRKDPVRQPASAIGREYAGRGKGKSST
jgi:hypothetical protein